MSQVKSVIKIVGYTALGFLLFITIYLGMAFLLSRLATEREPVTSEDVTIYILSNGVHVDLVVPVKNDQIDWSKKLSYNNTRGKDSLMNYLAVGWGDKGFYLETPAWSDLKFSTAFKALFFLNTTAIHATYFKQMKVGKDCKPVQISKEQYSRLVAYISNSFQLDENGNYIPIKTDAMYGNTDAFYEARGSYSFLHTCNTWSNNGLKSCGQKACIWTPFSSGIFYQYQLNK